MTIEGKHICPYCKVDTTFDIPDTGHTLVSMLKAGLMMLTNPKALFNSFIEKNGHIGQCSNCKEIVLQCPYCGYINYREYIPSPCSNCNKKFSHP